MSNKRSDYGSIADRTGCGKNLGERPLPDGTYLTSEASADRTVLRANPNRRAFVFTPKCSDNDNRGISAQCSTLITPTLIAEGGQHAIGGGFQGQFSRRRHRSHLLPSAACRNVGTITDQNSGNEVGGLGVDSG